MSKINELYRYEDSFSMDYSHLTEITYKVLRETPAGYWVVNGYSYGPEEWVSKTGKKRKAYPTKEEAMISYLHRKRFQIALLEGRLSKAKYNRALADAKAKTLGVSLANRNDTYHKRAINA